MSSFFVKMELERMRIEIADLREELAELRAYKEAVAWMIDGGVVMREDFAEMLGWSGAVVGSGRAIPDAWTPILYSAIESPNTKGKDD